MPFVVTQNVLLSETLTDALIGALSTRPGAALLTTPTVALYTDNHTPAPKTDTVSNFTLAAFTGYADAVISFGSVVNAGPNSRMIHGDVNFICTANFIGPTIKGAILYNGATGLFAQVAFDVPIPMANAGDELNLQLVIPLQFAQAAV